MQPDVVHGHGAKGGPVRLARSGGEPSGITPHGGSLYYRSGTDSGGFYRSLEWL